MTSAGVPGPHDVGRDEQPLRVQLGSVALIQAGRLQTVPHEGEAWTTAIYKTPLTERVTVGQLGIAGDQHTGHAPDPERALCCCPMGHYTYWRAFLRGAIPLGTFGENLTLAGMAEEDVCIGDVLRCGGLLMQVSQPRMPCYKQARRLGQPDFVKLIMQTGRLGFLTRILDPGSMQVGDTVELVERPCPEVPLPHVVRVFQTRDESAAAALAALPLLANEWRERFATLR